MTLAVDQLSTLDETPGAGACGRAAARRPRVTLNAEIPTPLSAALQTAKTILAVPESIGSAALSELPASLRQRLFFSARTPYAQYLSDTNSLLSRLLQPESAAPGESVNPAIIRGEMKKALASLGYQPDPEKRGGLQDLSSDRRTNLIIQMQTAMANNYGRWREAQSPVVLTLYPADELFRAVRPKSGQGRPWAQRWNEARANLGPDNTSATEARDNNLGPFVALKNDPIWTAISAFNNPYPPFDYGSGMRTRDVPRARAIALGVLRPDNAPQPAPDPANTPIELPLDTIAPALADALLRSFGALAKLIKNPLP
jgi:hypothetical protein